MKDKKNTLTLKMLTAMMAGLVVGLLMIVLRENLIQGGHQETWQTINNVLFADITAEGNESAIGLFYIVGQLFIRSLQLVIVPMVFCSIVTAIIKIKDASKLKRMSGKTIGFFLLTTVSAIILAAVAGTAAYSAGFFNVANLGLEQGSGQTAANPLNIIINAVPNNLAGALSNNGGVLAIVVSAVVIGLCINRLQDKVTIIPKVCDEISNIITVFLNIIVEKFGPIAIFCLLSRTFAAYGIAYLKPAAAYVVLTTALLLATLFGGYALFVFLTTGLNPIHFIKKIAPVALFGFSTSSSAATLPLNMETTTEKMGVDKGIASFVLPLGMTINMDGTAIMQVIAALFIAGAGGYKVSFSSILLIGVLAIIASVGTPAAPGAGAVILFTILSGVGFTNEPALMAYSLILAINRPIEMLVTSLNVVGDAACSMAVAKSEGLLDKAAYETEEVTESAVTGTVELKEARQTAKAS